MKIPLEGRPVEDDLVRRLSAAIELAAKPMDDADFRKKHWTDDVASSVAAAALDAVLIGYRHPVHEFKNWTILAAIGDAIPFLREKIRPDHGQGLDLDIASVDLTRLWMTNHDGDAYVLA